MQALRLSKKLQPEALQSCQSWMRNTMDWIRKIVNAARFSIGRESLAATFDEELHFHAGWVLVFSCAMSLAWLPYIPVDRALHPEQPVIVWLRWCLVVISIAVLLLRRVPYLRQRNQYLMTLWGCYAMTATGVITGLTSVDPTYVSGFVLVICLLPMVPLRIPLSISILVLGLAGFFTAAYSMEVDLTQARVRYTLNDIIVASIIVLFFIFLMNTYRYRTWKSAKIIERESSRRVQQADLENQAKSRFIATMSHEIRTPMNGIIGMAEMLHTTRLDKEQKNFVDVISYSGKSLLNVINDILDYSKIEADRVTLEKVEFNFYSLCAEVATVFKSTAGKNSIEFVVCVDPGIPARIKADPSRLRQVILNLIGNAFKFTRVGRIELKVEKGKDSPDGGELEFTILDTGIGISQAQQATLFKPFQQADSSITREYGGSGLGLSIAKSLIELMGGTISVDSAPRQGSTFTFTMHYETALREPQSGDFHLLANVKVLLVGRPSHYGMELTRHLQFSGVEVSTERTIADGIERIDRYTDGFTVVVVDLDSNSDVDPLLIERLQEACGLLSLDCMVLTADEYPRYGFKVINKPVCAFQFNHILAQALGKTDDSDSSRGGARAERVLADCSILVAEDNDINQKVIASMLDKLGARYTIAHNGRQACAEYASRHAQYDVVLMDCEMPVLDGEEATRRIREQEREQGWPRKPIIALTAHAMKEHIDSCMAAGMDDHIAKPVEMSILQEKILAAIKK